MEEERLFIPCDCGCSGLLITEDIEFYGKKNDRMKQEFYIALYAYGEINTKPSFWKRLKYAWWHIKTGKIYTDCVIMKDTDAVDLRNFLDKMLSEKNILAKQKEHIKN